MADTMSVTGKNSNVNQLYFDWKKLTAKEVIKKEKEGQTAPPEILKWAEEIAKLDNAPDDVTYDIAKGETDIDKLNELVNSTPAEETNNDKSEQEEQQQPQLSAAQNERKSMQDNGASLLEQGKTFTGRSKEASTESFRAMISGAQTANLAEGVSEKAEKEAQIIEMVTRNTKKEYDNLMQKAENQNGEGVTASELNRIKTLGDKLNTVGTKGQNDLRDRNNELNTYETRLKGLEAVPTNALDYGSETVFIGSELLGGKKVDTNSEQSAENTTSSNTQDDTAQRAQEALQTAKDSRFSFFKALFSRKAMVGYQAVTHGSKAIARGNAAQEVLNESTDKVNESKNRIGDAQNKVENATNVEAKQAPDNKGNENTNTENNNEENTNILADDKITTDANEIIKRKQRKGLKNT